MREILFRGKNEHRGWIYGDLRNYEKSGAKAIFSHELLHRVEVDPSTVGQFTGLTDKNGRKIFEGDILKTHYANARKCEFVEVVVFHNGRFCAEGNIGRNGRSWANLWDGVHHIPQDKTVYMDSMEVIGNIHDNPELLNPPKGE